MKREESEELLERHRVATSKVRGKNYAASLVAIFEETVFRDYIAVIGGNDEKPKCIGLFNVTLSEAGVSELEKFAASLAQGNVFSHQAISEVLSQLVAAQNESQKEYLILRGRAYTKVSQENQKRSIWRGAGLPFKASYGPSKFM